MHAVNFQDMRRHFCRHNGAGHFLSVVLVSIVLLVRNVCPGWGSTGDCQLFFNFPKRRPFRRLKISNTHLCAIYEFF